MVEDSAPYRRIICEAIQADPELQVVGVAANGQKALEQFSLIKPDGVVLDLIMPVMDGIATLKALRRLQPSLPILICTSISEASVSLRIDETNRMNTDIFEKPSPSSPRRASLQADLTMRIKALCRDSAAMTPAPVHGAGPRVRPDIVPRAVVVAASTGGPKALELVLRSLPGNFPWPILVTQHMPADFTPRLANSLNAACRLSVGEAADNDTIRSGHVYIAPGGQHLTVGSKLQQEVIVLSDAPPVNSCKPSADVMFASAAKTYGEQLIAIVLTGVGCDGLEGCRTISQTGGMVIAQDKTSSVAWGMPGVVVTAKLADFELPLGQIPVCLAGLSAKHRT